MGCVRAHYNIVGGTTHRTFDYMIQFAADDNSNNNRMYAYPPTNPTITIAIESRLHHELYNPSGIIALLSSVTRNVDMGAVMMGMLTVTKMQLLRSVSRYIHDRF